MYLWLKALHIIAVISWMAGLLYLPRLMIYHCEAEKGSVQSETFKTMERRLLKAIMTPAMIVSWGLGLYLAFVYVGFKGNTWLHVKFLFVIMLSASHGFMARWVREFAEDRNTRSQRFYRIANEVPTLLMIGIVILAVVKPF
jgi:protoporphyrinogen IX oxidase